MNRLKNPFSREDSRIQEISSMMKIDDEMSKEMIRKTKLALLIIKDIRLTTMNIITI